MILIFWLEIVIIFLCNNLKILIFMLSLVQISRILNCKKQQKILKFENMKFLMNFDGFRNFKFSIINKKDLIFFSKRKENSYKKRIIRICIFIISFSFLIFILNLSHSNFFFSSFHSFFFFSYCLHLSQKSSYYLYLYFSLPFSQMFSILYVKCYLSNP